MNNDEKLEPFEIHIILSAFNAVVEEDGIKTNFDAFKNEFQLVFPKDKIMRAEDFQQLVTTVLKELNSVRNLTLVFTTIYNGKQVFRMKINSKPKPIVN